MKYIHLMNIPPMTVVETAPFLRDAKGLLPEDERARLVSFLGTNPEAGDLIEDTGGVRKLRWARKGGGKSGGYRVLYYYYSERIPLFVPGIYAKNAKESVDKAEKNIFKKLTSLLRQSYGV